MDLVSLPQELVYQILIRSPSEKIINLGRKNKTIHDIISRPQFWEEKLDFEYPGYAGNLYNDSAEKTLFLLEQPKEIKIKKLYHKFDIKKKITPYTTMTELIDFIDRSSPFRIFLQTGEWFYATLVRVNLKYKLFFHISGSKWKIWVFADTPLYRIELWENKNLYLQIAKVSDSILETRAD